MVSRFRALRISCKISQREIAQLAGVTSQRLSQIEYKHFGYYPQDPERMIKALETVLRKRKNAIIRAEKICMYERATLFDYEKDGDSDD